MKLRKLEENGKRMIIEFEDETIAFANMIKDKLWEDSAVKEAATIREHPYLSRPKILIEVSRGSPQDALEKAAKKLLNESAELEEKLKMALKK